MDETHNKPKENEAALLLEEARLRVIVAFAYWFFCQKRLKDLAQSFHSLENSASWLASFSQLRRAARNAEVRWVTAIYGFKRLVEVQDAGKWKN